jgi:hypothetical protein
VIRIDLVRAAEQELRDAFARGDLDQHMREYVAAFVRADVPVPAWLTKIQVPGYARDLACYNLAKEWAALPPRGESVVSYARSVLRTRVTEFAAAPVVQLSASKE